MSLTPGFKKFVALVGTVAVVGTGYWAWHSGKIGGHVPGSTTASAGNFTAPSGGSAPAAPAKASDHDLTVSLVSFHGYAPAIVANGNSMTTQPGSIYSKLGLNANLIIQDNIPTLTEIFTAKTAQCAWRTSDFWAQEQPNLRNSGLDAKAVMVVDNTQGGDAIIAKDPSIKSVEDLAGKSVALLQYTPSHGLLINAINNSSLSGRKKESIKLVFINADEGTGGVRAAFESGKVDAAVLWDPDLSLAVRNGHGHVVYSTKQATNLIYDVMVCDQAVLNSPDGHAAVQKFVAGWLEGVKAAKANQDLAVDALMNNEDMFRDLGNKEGKPFIKGLFSNLLWTDLADNARILGLTPGGTNNYERVYHEFDGIYREAGALANPKSPVIDPAQSFDYSFVKTLLASDSSAAAAAQQETVHFSGAGLAQATRAAVTKPVAINFSTGSAELTAASRAKIDKEMVPFIQDNGSAYVELSGNTDSTGSTLSNLALSQRRAQVVAEYLVKEWEIPAARFKVTGNGSNAPICVEPGTNDGLSLEECRAANRATRIAVLTR
jgi:outer membrane protein OmpA-like peptidoglycan-associated protein/ABC-type amino acid transport substrate-binding protein